MGKCGEWADASIKYKVKTVINTANEKDKMVFDHELMIRQPPVEFMPNELQVNTQRLKCCCCCKFGSVKIGVQFEKNVFTPQEKARATITCDAGLSKLDVKRINFCLEQRMFLKSHLHSCTASKDWIKSSVEGPKAGQSNFQTKIELDLA